jgi:hypothetical protein
LRFVAGVDGDSVAAGGYYFDGDFILGHGVAFRCPLGAAGSRLGGLAGCA